VHALAFSAGPTQLAFERAWPDAQVAHLSDGSLYLDRSQGTADEAEITRRIGRLLEHSAACGAQGTIFTGSFFGDSVRQMRTNIKVPVLTSFEGVIERALELEQPLCILSTAADSTTYLAEEIHATAKARGQTVVTKNRVVAGAIDALNANDEDTHDRLVLETIAEVGKTHAVVMAQFTMERVIEQTSRVTDAPVIGPATEGAAWLRKVLLQA
jgi:Asp/Glu/hydantoin racemase